MAIVAISHVCGRMKFHFINKSTKKYCLVCQWAGLPPPPFFGLIAVGFTNKLFKSKKVFYVKYFRTMFCAIFLRGEIKLTAQEEVLSIRGRFKGTIYLSPLVDLIFFRESPFSVSILESAYDTYNNKRQT